MRHSAAPAPPAIPPWTDDAMDSIDGEIACNNRPVSPQEGIDASNRRQAQVAAAASLSRISPEADNFLSEQIQHLQGIPQPIREQAEAALERIEIDLKNMFEDYACYAHADTQMMENRIDDILNHGSINNLLMSEEHGQKLQWLVAKLECQYRAANALAAYEEGNRAYELTDWHNRLFLPSLDKDLSTITDLDQYDQASEHAISEANMMIRTLRDPKGRLNAISADAIRNMQEKTQTLIEQRRAALLDQPVVQA